jgi:hypothetical protein
MFWAFLIAAAIAIVLIQLGAMSVWVTVLSLALKAMLAAVFAIALYAVLRFVWRHYKDGKQGE